MNNRNCRKKKNEKNKLFDLSKFEEWFALTYTPVNCGGQKVPKVISFKEHIRILKERDNHYNRLLNDYNKLVDDFNSLRKAYFEATDEGTSWANLKSLEIKNEQLKAQNAKMKNCANCQRSYEKNAELRCDVINCLNFDKWELEE